MAAQASPRRAGSGTEQDHADHAGVVTELVPERDRRASHATFGRRTQGSRASSTATDEQSIASGASTPDSADPVRSIVPRAFGTQGKGIPLAPLLVECSATAHVLVQPRSTVHALAEPRSRQSKLDKVLGHGAETARVILDIERRDASARAESRTQRRSLDSVGSLNESISTLTDLLPAALNPADRAQLVRRARKVEQVLGETLREAQVGEHIVQPANTLWDHQAWPSLSTGPEWEAQDVVPRRADDSHQSSLDPFADCKPSLGGRAVAALRKATRHKPDELEIYVARETMTVFKREAANSDYPTVNLPRDVPPGPPSPDSISTASGSSEDDSDDEAKRARRVRLAKLHRLLGTTIPPSLVRKRPPIQGSPASFMSLDGPHRQRWPSKLIAASAMKHRPGPSHDHAASLIPVGDRMTDKERQVARKRANKLEHVFGTLPPSAMFVTSSQDSIHALRPAPASTFDTYQQSLQGLLYLVQNNQHELGRILDELAPPPDRPSPDPESFATRRKRAGKLSHFFGEPRAGESTHDRLDRVLGDVWKGARAEARIGALRTDHMETLGFMMGDLTSRRADLDVSEQL